MKIGSQRYGESQGEQLGQRSFSHYADAPIAALDGRTYRQEELSPSSKPVGLWVSVDGPDDWTEWCDAESLGRGAFAHRVTFQQDHRLLLISSLANFDNFQRKFGRGTYSPRHCGIAWAEVAQRYQGVIIAPYQWARRYSAFWYYGWDCASGCIWDLSAIGEWSALPPVADKT